MKLSTNYHVHFICDPDDEHFWEVKFTCQDPEDVKKLVAACAAYNSGDECKCFINGEEAVLEGDWGLLL